MYRHAVSPASYADFASGGVLHSAPGHPAFPVRLADEMFLRCAALLGDSPICLWDPLCGSGYLVTVLGLRHRRRLAHVYASDIDPEALALAQRNLSLLTDAGLRQREEQLRERAASFGKPAYAQAADTAVRLRADLIEHGGDLAYTCSVADAFTTLPPPANVVLTDLPYGEQTHWRGDAPAAPAPALLERLADGLSAPAVVALARPAGTGSWGRPATQRLRVGRRDVAIFLV